MGAATGGVTDAPEVNTGSAAVVMDFKRAYGRSITFLMQPAMLGRAKEHLPGHEAFAAREMDAALSTAHHVLGGARAARGALRRPSHFPLVRLEEPIHKHDNEYEDEIFQGRSSELEYRHGAAQKFERR